MGPKISVDSATMMSKGLELIEACWLFATEHQAIDIVVQPRRMSSGVSPLDLIAQGRLEFEAPDELRFPCLRLARQAIAAGGSLPTALNAANEVAVAAFLEQRIRFTSIPAIIEQVLAATEVRMPTSLAEVEQVDAAARREARSAVEACAGQGRFTQPTI